MKIISLHIYSLVLLSCVIVVLMLSKRGHDQERTTFSQYDSRCLIPKKSPRGPDGLEMTTTKVTHNYWYPMLSYTVIKSGGNYNRWSETVDCWRKKSEIRREKDIRKNRRDKDIRKIRRNKYIRKIRRDKDIRN